MRIVKFVAKDTEWPIHRQTPAGDGIFGKTRFVFDPAARTYDFIVVFGGLPPEFRETIDPNRAVFVASEPPNVKLYRAEFLNQFGTVLTADRSTDHPNARFTQVGLPWHFATTLSFSELEALTPRKTKLASVICSDKAMTPEHRQRIRFVAELEKAFGSKIDVFGRGRREIPDKAEALLSYRYHIALENCSIQDYWTEKISDPFLAGCYPIYWGCTNLEDYFPADSFAPIDITRPEEAIARTAELIDSDEDLRCRDAVREARRRTLYEHNLFALLDRTVEELAMRTDKGSPRKPVVLKRKGRLRRFLGRELVGRFGIGRRPR